ncbi:hypothetical protein K438DRAFT_1815734 [Mycena galopus ATCC 62051]|nr:hypothetical protein K438DRAFT_1815734 [Mycena galopus ATCC 62051]
MALRPRRRLHKLSLLSASIREFLAISLSTAELKVDLDSEHLTLRYCKYDPDYTAGRKQRRLWGTAKNLGRTPVQNFGIPL